MNYLSVCSGIEAASVAWHPIGWKPVGFAEIEPFPAAVLAHHYPTVPNFGDMTQLHDLIEMGICDAPEILVGGTPCQAFSVAGLRKSLDDDRGNLALVYCDLANAIDARRKGAGLPPAILVWENVPGVLSTKDNAFGCFLAGLAGEDEPLVPAGKRWSNAGYVLGPQRAVAWRILDAQYFGLAQRRRRVFVIASARDGFDPATVLFEWEGVRRDSAPSRPEEGPVTGATEASTRVAGCWWDGGDVSQTLDAVLQKSQAMPEKNRFPAVLQTIAFHASQDPISGDVVPALSGNALHGVTTRHGVRYLMPVEAERLQGFPSRHTQVQHRGRSADTCPDGPRRKAIGNSMAVPCMHWIGARIDAHIKGELPSPCEAFL